MKYTFESEDLTCVGLEAKLGLKRGEVKEITTYPTGSVDINVDDAVASEIVKGKIQDELKARGLPRGKKPIR